MKHEIAETRHEESFQRIKNDFISIEDEKLRKLYVKFRSDLESGAIIFDFIPILAEKSLRNFLRKI